MSETFQSHFGGEAGVSTISNLVQPGFGVVCHHPACTGASPACRLLPSETEESHNVLGDGASPLGH
jgi:hypothetical protein